MRTAGSRRGAAAKLFGIGVLVVIVLGGAATAWLVSGRSRPVTPNVVLIGVDGGDWRLIRPLVEEGRLPNFERLIDEGATGDLTSYQPTMSPQVWNTIVTGKHFSEHGIDWFVVRLDDPSQREELDVKAPVIPITSKQRKVPAVWDVLSDVGDTVGVIGFWATWPATPVNGFMVSDRFSYSRVNKLGGADTDLEYQTYPPELADELREFVMSPEEVTPEDRARFMGEPVEAGDWRTSHDIVGEFDITLAQAETYRDTALHMLEQGQPDFFAVYFQGVDVTSHYFWEFMRPDHAGRVVQEEDIERYRGVIAAFYEYQDEILGELMDRVSDDSIIIVCSDHGFRDLPFQERTEPHISGWHRLNGILAIWGAGVREGARLERIDVYDIMPTILAIKKLPLARDMNGRVLEEAFKPGVLGESKHVDAYTKMPEVPDIEDLQTTVDDAMLERLKSIGYIGGE